MLCPLCGAKVVKKKSRSGYYYYGCEKNPACTFMTWDKPTNKKCPNCGEPLYKRYTKAEKKYVCYKPGCGYEEDLPQRKSKKKDEEAPAAEQNVVASAENAAETPETAKATKAKKAAKTTKTAKAKAQEEAGEEKPKKTTRKSTKKAAGEGEETPKKKTTRKTAAKKAAEKPEAEEENKE